MNRHRLRSKQGFTLLEMMIVLTILSLAVLAANSVSVTGMGVFRSTSVNTKLDNDALRAIDRVVAELVEADGDTLLPLASDDGTEDLLFQSVVGVDGEDPIWGPMHQLRFEYSAGEANNGVDDNADGRIDEGVLVLERNIGEADEHRVILCRGLREHLPDEVFNGIDDNGNGLVDENGFCIQREGNVLSIWLSLEALDSTEILVERTLQTSLRLRNGS